jgi:hypothetical protein
MKFYEHTSKIKMKKINDLDSKFKYQALKYKLKDKLMELDATKASGTKFFLLFNWNF